MKAKIALLTLLLLTTGIAWGGTAITKTLSTGQNLVFLGTDAPYLVQTKGTGGTCLVEATASATPGAASGVIWKAWTAGATAAETSEGLMTGSTALRVTVSAGTCVLSVSGSQK